MTLVPRPPCSPVAGRRPPDEEETDGSVSAWHGTGNVGPAWRAGGHGHAYAVRAYAVDDASSLHHLFAELFLKKTCLLS
jgi:hypothetical protein